MNKTNEYDQWENDKTQVHSTIQYDDGFEWKGNNGTNSVWDWP